MVKALADLPEDIYSLLDGSLAGDISVLDKFGPELGLVLKGKLDKKERKPSLRMSNIGRPLRQLWYELNGYEAEKVSGKTILKFSYGDLTEALVLVLAEAAGHSVTDFQEEIEVDGIKGHIDAVVDGILVDVKSCSAYSFQKFKNGSLLEEGNDPFGYVGQLSGYAKAKNLPAAWIAFDKQSGEICVLTLPQDRITTYDISARIELVRASINETTPPARCYQDEADGKSGNRKLAVGCSYCGHKFECWKDSNNGEGLKTYIYSTGPRFLTNVSREPNVFSTNKKDN